MKLTFVRHTSVDVERGTCYGQSDVPLKPSFPEEAEEVRRKLEGKQFDKVYTSPLSRCTMLASFCGYPDAIHDDRLKELNFGDWEMKKFDEIKDPRLQEWFDDYFNVAPTGGESFAEQQTRLRDFIADLKQTGMGSILIFAHGGIQLQAMTIAGIIDAGKAFDHLQPYGGVIEIEF